MTRRRPRADQSDLRTAALVIAAMRKRWPGRAHMSRHTMRRIYYRFSALMTVVLMWPRYGRPAWDTTDLDHLIRLNIRRM
jgi:hypothetical protein